VKLLAGAEQFAEQPAEGIHIAPYGSVMPDFTFTSGIGQCHFYGVFVNIETDKCDTILHELPP
jgi:hypothetical protein